jgi:hypothetical protein
LRWVETHYNPESKIIALFNTWSYALHETWFYVTNTQWISLSTKSILSFPENRHN